jgi:hypothetical protein
MTVVMERRERAFRLCRELSRQVSYVAPPGLGHWEPAWEIVEEPSCRFLEVLDNWVQTGDDETKHGAKINAGKVLDAWREASQRYREAGRPIDSPLSTMKGRNSW